MLNKGMSITMIIVSVVAVIITGYYTFRLVSEIIKGQRKFDFRGKYGVFALAICATLLTGVAYCLYHAPYILFGGVSWLFIAEWGPTSLIYAVICLAIIIPVICMYCLLNFFFTKENDKPYFMTVILSIISALGNSIVVFMVNQALNMSASNESRAAATESGLYIYYLLGIAIFTVCALIVRKILIDITSDIIYEKRMDIIHKILKSPYEKIEELEDGIVQAVLNNDTEAISSFVNDFVNGLTGILTLITCYIYLGTQNFLGMITSLGIIILAVYMFLVVSKRAEEKYEKNRDVQDTFFKHINSMMNGFKELSISRKKKHAFTQDIEKSCEDYKRTRREGQTAFLGVSMLGEVLYLLVIGFIVFLFPILFPKLTNTTMRNYVTVYLYMGGIINSEIYLVPGIMRILVSYRRINKFMDRLILEEDDTEELSELAITRDATQLEIKIEDVTYQYANSHDDSFMVGPVNCSFKSGEITFISGGNGSGKSTLAKLLTGLYTPKSGAIYVNGEKMRPSNLRKYYTAIFSDYYLFDKMYGIDYENTKEKAKTYLEKMRIKKQVCMENGCINPDNLSTGQRKRLALVLSYLEDKDIFLFDEWAADQDPEFRKFFYMELLKELKERGKIVIAITHDDKYFDEADHHVKMEYGHMIALK